MRFLADMGVNPTICESLKRAGHDAVHLREHGLHRLSDLEIFDKAELEGRTTLTFDLDFGEIVALSFGRLISVVVFRLRDTRTRHVAERLRDVLAQSTPALENGANG